MNFFKAFLSIAKKAINFLLTNRFWFISVFSLFIFLIAVSTFDLDLPIYIHYQRADAARLMSITITNFISVFGISIAIGAIIFSIIQSQKSEEDIISIIFKDSFFLPFLWFSILSIIFLFIVFHFDSDFYSSHGVLKDSIFIRYSILGSFLFLIHLILIGFSFLRIYKLLNSDYLFNQYLKDVEKYALQNSDKDKDLKKIVKRFESRFKQTLLDSNIDKADIIFELYKRIYVKNPKSIIFKEFIFLIRKLNTDLMLERNDEALFNLYHYLYELFKIIIKSKNIDELKHYINLIPIIYNEAKSNKYQVERIVKDLSDRLWFLISIEYEQEFEQTQDNNNKDLLNKIVYPILNAYCLLIRDTIKYSDTESLKIILNSLERNEDYKRYDDLDVINRRIEFIRSNNEANNTYLSDIQRDTFLIDNIFYLKFGLRAWILKLFMDKQIEDISLRTYLNLIDLKFDYSVFDLISLIYCINNAEKLFNWNNWEYETRDWEEGKVFWSEGPTNWLIWGFIFEIVRTNLLKVVEDDLGWQDLNDDSDIDKFKRKIIAFRQNNTMISTYLDLNEEEFEKRLSKLEEIIDKLSVARKTITISNLAKTSISQIKVNEFINVQGIEWGKFNIENIFGKYDAITTINNGEVKLKKLGANIHYMGGKSYFLDSYPETIYHTFNLGTQIRTQTNEIFFGLIQKESKESIPSKSDSIIDALDNMINQLNKNKYKADIIFGSKSLLLTNSLFYNNNYFKKASLSIQEGFGFSLIGFYRDIPILASQNPMDKKIIAAASFKNFINLKEKQNKKWYNNKLSITVSEIDEEMATEIFNSNPDLYLMQDDIKLDKDTAILNLLGSVSIGIERIFDFEILNKTAIVFSRLEYEQ